MNLFIITPYDSDPLFVRKRNIVEAIAAKFGMFPHYGPYGQPNTDSTARSVVDLIRQAEFFVADLSYARPSCYFEVGFAQALGKDGHLTAIEGTPIHQVLDREQVTFFKDLQEYETLINQVFSQHSI